MKTILTSAMQNTLFLIIIFVNSIVAFISKALFLITNINLNVMDAATLDFISKVVLFALISYQLHKINKQDKEFKKQFVQNKMLLLINEMRFRNSQKEQHPYSMYEYMEKEKIELKSVMHKEYPKMSGEDIDAEINLYYNKYQPKLEDIQVNVV